MLLKTENIQHNFKLNTISAIALFFKEIYQCTHSKIHVRGDPKYISKIFLKCD